MILTTQDMFLHNNMIAKIRSTKNPHY